MPNNYVAPYIMAEGNVILPDGQFIVPVCTTKERFDKIMNALWYYGQQQDRSFDFDHLIDWMDAMPRIRPGCDYDPTDGCSVMLPDNSNITWHPESPYAIGAEVPSGYNFHPWTIVTDSLIDQIILQWGLGYKVGDILTDFQKIPIGSSFEDLLTTGYLNFPRFQINNLVGRGSIKLHLLNIPQGGRAWILIDDVIHINLPANKFVELDTDLTSFPPETNTEVIVEVEIESSGTHHVTVVFIPAMDIAFIPLFFGGGLRAVEVCGFEMPLLDPCCPDDAANDETLIYNSYVTQYSSWVSSNLSTSILNQILYDGTPESLYPEAGANFDSEGEGVLCAAIENYINSLIYMHSSRAAIESAVAAGIAAAIATFLAGVTFGISIPVGIAISAAIGVSSLAWRSILNDPAAVRDVRCCMYDSLVGQALTLENFQTSVLDCGFTGSNNNAILAAVINDDNANYAENYTAFLRALSQAHAESAENCQCGCDSDIELEDFEATGCVITYMGNCIYRFSQTTPIVEGGADRWYHSFRDVALQCLLVEASPDPSMPTDAVDDHRAIDCTGAGGEPVIGGFGGELRSAHWRGRTITHYKITLAV